MDLSSCSGMFFLNNRQDMDFANQVQGSDMLFMLLSSNPVKPPAASLNCNIFRAVMEKSLYSFSFASLSIQSCYF